MAPESTYVSLADAVLLQRGFDLPAYAREAGETPVVASTGVVGHHSVSKVDPPGVVVGRSGSIGGGQYLTVPYWPLNTTLWVKDFRGNDPRFVYYMVRNIDFRQLNAGSGVPTLNRHHLHGTQVWIPDVNEQRRIATVLGSLDDKIDSNRRLALLLEETAAMLFCTWFVDFVGIEAFEESETGRIPRGWKHGLVSDLCDTRYGYTASAEERPVGPKFLRVKDINKQPWIDWDAVPYCAIESRSIERFRLLPGDVVVARMADPGKAAIVVDEIDAVCASYLVRLRPISIEWSYFLHRYLRSGRYQEYINSVMAGSVQKNINARVLVAAPILMPPVAEATSFAELVDPVYRQQALVVRESSTLSALRDALLPKLVSGEIRVPDTTDPEEVIGPAAEALAEART